MVVTRNEWGDSRRGKPQAAMRRLTIRPMSPAVMGRIVSSFVFRIDVVKMGRAS